MDITVTGAGAPLPASDWSGSAALGLPAIPAPTVEIEAAVPASTNRPGEVDADG
jgi:hypothetical protein